MTRTKEERKVIVRELAELGISQSQIAELLGVSISTVNSDCKSFGGVNSLPDRPTTQDEVFVAVFTRYAKEYNRSPRDRTRSYSHLATWLDEEGILTYISGSLAVISEMCKPTSSEDLGPYGRLIASILGTVSGTLQDSHMAWYEYLDGIVMNDFPVPQAGRELKRDISTRLVHAYRKHFILYWGAVVPAIVEDTLVDLSDVEQFVLRQRFGLDGNGPKTLQDVSDELVRIQGSKRVSRERIRQVEQRAMAKLRGYFTEFNPFTNRGLSSIIEDHLRQKHADINSAGANLSKIPIRDLGLSERPMACLRRAQVETVGDLLMKTEDDLLAIVNFGIRSLREVVDKLDEHGLQLRSRPSLLSN